MHAPGTAEVPVDVIREGVAQGHGRKEHLHADEEILVACRHGARVEARQRLDHLCLFQDCQDNPCNTSMFQDTKDIKGEPELTDPFKFINKCKTKNAMKLKLLFKRTFLW